MAQYDAQQTALETELEQVVTELSVIASQAPHTGDWVAVPGGAQVGNADPNEEADTVEEWNQRRALVAQLEIRYRNIVRALEKIKNDTYGVCEISGEPIEEARLAANPAARTNLANADREKELPL